MKLAVCVGAAALVFGALFVAAMVAATGSAMRVGKGQVR